ncbi:hypothetical protein PUNSTDRAFT_65319 [Punctularia strigosozonata HHB-11173 SS5]|uniref:uncharacterized protein n=1 Tax=Punctularia strigosozonata (strain HHB-11173) TaxID=741275 RepID=UPI0004416F8A|nr:uncharacterized protein PUNSTDRAFT_65319 [Punctularia strigosozonata HHB-11173 SS5]EIN10424.1 hypothetical protein PUNSTDRAFT_65319 [Punctularia strigosozonata HHB-11173 SS5]
MPYSVRNAHYLRISPHSVMPFYLYLDERHVEWMSDRVLQRVLADLQPLLIPKLRAEADVTPGNANSNGKKGTVDVHRGDDYQFAFFFRQTEPHSVLIKTRDFIVAPTQPAPPVPSGTASERAPKSGKDTWKGATGNTTTKKRKKGSRTRRDVGSDESDTAGSSSGEDAAFQSPPKAIQTTRRSTRRKRAAPTYDEPEEGTTQDPEFRMQGTLDDPSQPRSPQVKEEDPDSPLPGDPGRRDTSRTPIELHVDEDEAKPKPLLRLKYQGFNIVGRCLSVVVEPWPPIRATSVAPVFTRSAHARPQNIIAPPSSRRDEAASMRAQTPLFLPDDDPRATPAPSSFPVSPPHPLPPLPSFDDAEEQHLDFEEDGLIQFSQALKSGGGLRAGEAYDDDEMDGAVFFADADEARELY